ncbi:hypothetical protein COBT_002692 [Conglomerata obtusa]
MVFSIEPGYYKENEYGIRIEDLVVTREKSEKFIKIINLTLVPLQKKMIYDEILTNEQQDYLIQFDERVKKILSSFIKPNELGYKFLMENT